MGDWGCWNVLLLYKLAPQNLKECTTKRYTIQQLFWTVDEHNTLVARWMDNGMVFCVSTMHKIGAVIKRRQKRPRVTLLNKRHVNTIWGTEGVADIFIPTLIDDYNHWMGGVDLSDQRISYYHADLQCY